MREDLVNVGVKLEIQLVLLFWNGTLSLFFKILFVVCVVKFFIYKLHSFCSKFEVHPTIENHEVIGDSIFFRMMKEKGVVCHKCKLS
jgi:hypothetical protein